MVDVDTSCLQAEQWLRLFDVVQRSAAIWPSGRPLILHLSSEPVNSRKMLCQSIDWSQSKIFLVISCVCIENATEGEQEELVVKVTKQLVTRIHGLMNDAGYVMSMCATTSVGCGPAISVTAVTQPLSC